LLGPWFPGEGDGGDVAVQHGGVQAGQQFRVEYGGGRVGGVGEGDGGGQGGGYQVAVAFDAAGALVGALGEVLAGAGAAGAVLGQRGGAGGCPGH
jgi:hypothetical protein